MKEILVMLADDHLMFREGLKSLLEMDDIRVVEQANDGVECLCKVETSKPDVLLLDINLPKLDGISVLESVKGTNPFVKVIMLTIHNEVDYLLKAYDKGADGYVLKDSGFNQLKKAIRIVLEGERYIEPVLIPKLRERLESRNKKETNDELLSKREFEVLKLVAVGMYNKEIANHLSISEKTVKNHISSIFRKIHVSDRTQAAVFAIRHNYVSLD